MENIILSPLTVFIVPGGQETVSVNVTNESAIVDHFTMEVEGLPDGWATPPPGSMPLMPNQETGFQVVIGPLPLIDDVDCAWKLGIIAVNPIAGADLDTLSDDG